ncbi:PASTA domain-containing protein [Amycolatopsis carbonis]|uniref:PASTA domain-containing protein n=1 Tax=Amycolatopsis carbonis TaxID=715471 RepID=A0A9Y2IC31_9PSEU|nr:PASTA domain-containing protein [Amycolatopsis sp. 2-15]WIX77332.1 PASTA domain-containing protein [Amycolatopsis sp. 2-15]
MNQLGKAALVLLATACGAQPGTSGTPATTAETASAPATSETKPPETTTPAEITVPDVSGMNHQDAQDKMQAAGLYNLREVDSSGQHRAMILDRNWCQTGQDPKPGTAVPAGTVITLYADKC